MHPFKRTLGINGLNKFNFSRWFHLMLASIFHQLLAYAVHSTQRSQPAHHAIYDMAGMD